MKKRALALLMAGTMALSLAACGGGSEQTTSASAGKTVDGKVLDADQTYNTYLMSDPSTLDISKGNDNYGWNILINTMEPLTRMDEQDGQNVRIPAGAESWESNEDGSVWTFHLRDNKWSDGQAVTASDYVYGIQRTLDPASGSLNGYLITCIKNGAAVNSGDMDPSELGVKAVDDKTLEITLENPTPYFLSLTDTRALLPQRQDLIEQYGDSYGADADKYIGNGPFKLDTWTHNSELVLVKNENYYDQENVYLDKVVFKILTDESAIFNSFDNGSLDAVSTGTREWMDRFDQKNGVSRVDYDNSTIRYHFFNTKDALFQNENIRKAFSAAIDREDVNQTIYFGNMTPYTGWVPSTVSLGDTNYREAAGEMMTDTMSEDPKALLLKGMEELGLGSDPSTITVTFTLGGTNQWLKTYGEYFQQIYQQKLGVNIVLDQNEWGTFQQKTNSGDYQMAYMSWGIDYNDPISMLEIMKSDAGSIPTFWENAEFDALIGEASAEMDEAKRLELCKEAETILLSELPVCPVVNEAVHSYNYDYVNNMATTPFTTMGVKKLFISGR
ncbi:MAG: ABC transporter substrate-binding protein [Eubacteriales bacterium]|nr:ABC transporter substrate-binding protein [Eubacteriales bacterium]